MNTGTFNPLAVARDLEAAGVERRQAEAHAEALRAAVESNRGDLATKADLAELETRLIKWVLGIAIAHAALTFGLLKMFLP